MNEKNKLYIETLVEQRKNLFCQYVRDLDKLDTNLMAAKIIRRHFENEFINSWKKLVEDPKHQLVISDPEQIKFYDDSKKLVDSILKVRLAQKEIPFQKPHNLLLKKIQQIDNEIKWLKNHHKEGVRD